MQPSPPPHTHTGSATYQCLELVSATPSLWLADLCLKSHLCSLCVYSKLSSGCCPLLYSRVKGLGLSFFFFPWRSVTAVIYFQRLLESKQVTFRYSSLEKCDRRNYATVKSPCSLFLVPYLAWLALSVEESRAEQVWCVQPLCTWTPARI